MGTYGVLETLKTKLRGVYMENYKGMDIRALLEKVETICGWDEPKKERMAEALHSVGKAEDMDDIIESHVRELSALADSVSATRRALKEAIVFYTFTGIYKDGSEMCVMAFYDIDEARQEAKVWKRDNNGYIYITLCATTETEVEELLKAFPEEFLDSHPELKDPRDEYSLSLVSNSDMVISEIYSEWDEGKKEF